MKIMNRNLTGKLEEMNGMQNVDTHVALSGDFSNSCQQVFPTLVKKIHNLASKVFTKLLKTFAPQKYVVSCMSSPEGRFFRK